MLQKLGVNITLLHPKLRNVLDKIDKVFLEHAKREAIITSGNDSRHSPNSFHYKNRAIDLRTRDLSSTVIGKIYFDLVRELGNEFDVVREINHIHIEYDPK